MGLIGFVKNRYIKGTLTKITEGDMGSTVVGTIALVLLLLDINFDLAFQLFVGTIEPAEILELVKIAFGLVVGLIAWFTGKREKRQIRELLFRAGFENQESNSK